VVTVEQEQANGDWRFLLRPNIAVDWGQTLFAYGVIATMSLGSAVVLSWRGHWPILLFAIGTLLTLGWALYHSAHRAYEWDVVIVRADRIEIRQGRRNGERSWVLPSYWTEVVLQPAGHVWYPSQLLLRSGGVTIEIGRFLHEEERTILAQQLRRRIGFMGGSGDRA